MCEGAPPFESCGDCELGLTPTDAGDPLSQCTARITCVDLTCGMDEFCVESTTGGDATCVTSTCGATEAFDRNSGMCVSCGIDASDCDQVGHTGRIWPFSRDGGECVCETEPGFYFDTSSALIPRECDADGDGWIVAGARPFLEHPDEAVRENARCNLRTIDRVTLQNDLNQRLDVQLCLEGLVAAPDGPCAEVAPIDLYESAILDDHDAIDAAPGFFPRYQDGTGTGRGLDAVELNPLTRACVSSGGDFNNNGLPDIEESHDADTTMLGLTGTERTFYQLAFFVELNRGWIEERPSAEYDRYVVAERSRCDVGMSGEVPFPLAYDEPGGVLLATVCAWSRRELRSYGSGAGVRFRPLDLRRHFGNVSGSRAADP